MPVLDRFPAKHIDPSNFTNTKRTPQPNWRNMFDRPEYKLLVKRLAYSPNDINPSLIRL